MNLDQQLHDAPHTFDFFQALRRLECLHRDSSRIGDTVRPSEDPVRLAQDPSLSFAGSTLSTCVRGKGGLPSRLAVNFFGLFGSNGPLPLHLTEYARDRLRNSGDPTLIAFADLFHHRMLSLFYRARAMAEPTIEFDRPADDHFARYVGSLFGLGFESLRNRDSLSDRAKLYFAGRLASGPKNADGLSALLSELLEAPTSIDEFVGRWMRLPRDCRCRLGESPMTGALGETALLGERVWDCQHRFDVTVGPLSFVEFEQFLPGGNSLPLVGAIVQNYCGDELAWDLRLVLRGPETPPTHLGRSGFLGLTTWLHSTPPDRDVTDLVLRPVPELDDS